MFKADNHPTKLWHLKKFRHILLLASVFSFHTGNILLAQNSSSVHLLDSLLTEAKQTTGIRKITALDKISRYYWEKNPDSSLYYSNLALVEAQRDKSNEALGDAYNSMGNAYSSKHENETAITYYLKSKDYREKSGDWTKVGHSLSNLGLTLRDLKRYSESISSYRQAAKYYNDAKNYLFEGISYLDIAQVYRQLNDLNRALENAILAINIFLEHDITQPLARCYNFIGNLHKDLKNFDLAEDYYLKAYEIWSKANNLSGISSALNNLGIIYDEKGNYEKALENYNRSLDIAIQLNDSIGISTAYNNIGFIYVKLNQLERGINAYLKSMAISRQIGEIESYLNTCNNVASVYLKAGMLNKCEEYLNIVLGNLKSITELAYIQETYQLLSELYAKRGNYKKAFEFKSLQLAYNDSIYNQQQVRNILETQTRFETEAKEREIQLLKKDNEIKQLEFEKQRNFQNILTFITILLAIAIAVTIYISRIIRKKNLLLAEKNRALEEANKKMAETEVNLRELNATKDKLFSIIAHDLKNPFNALLGFSDILERNYNFLSDEERIEYIGVINDSTQSLYKLLDNLLQWTRTQTGTITYIPENFKLLPLVKQEITNVNLNSEKKKISITVNIDENISVFADKNTTATIIRNLLSNAIKFTDLGGHIEIAARYKDQMVETSVSDSGIGINDNDLDRIFMLDGSFTTKGTSNESGTGLGLLLCKEFVEKNNGKIWVESEKGKGSTFFFTLPAK